MVGEVVRPDSTRADLRRNRGGLPVVDIFELSKKMGTDGSLVAADGLHPSAKEYAEWEKIIFPIALELLSDRKSEIENRK